MNSNNPFGGAETVFIKDFAASNYSLSNSGKTLTATLPARSIVMFRLKLPPVKNVNEKNYSNKKFSISVKADCIELTNACISKNTPVAISLYGIDGKLIVDKYNGTIGLGDKNVVWKPQNRLLGKNTYIIKVRIGDVVQSKQIILE